MRKREYDKDAIKKLRERLNLTQSDFGRPMGMRSNQIAMLENHPGYPNVKSLLRIMNTYGVREDIFFT